ncbi:DUF4333 domain-containing protein [Actinomycetospora termitidis]|uniref:DUF4333 domain-containing protein n=1 Tax=Actinomycetospora termitidis TaxID=3053470 RepID=A0ABT7M147_9PSEU|nr:DUF4333 domain-containing protein [Actinomycetospora sp. Odt1-22]MDL5154384.1 DUF4333 domain-containing protein [Actinomycetospora sp. Odt1-22]
MPPQAPPPGRPGPAQRGPYPGPPPGPRGAPPPRPGPPPPRPPTGPFPVTGPGSGTFAAPPPRPPVQSVFGPGGPHRTAPSPPARRSRLAVVAVVLAVLVAPVGLVLGIVARRRITASSTAAFEQSPPERLTGRGAATAAIVIGLLLTLAEAALVVALTVGVPTSWLPSTDLTADRVQSTIEQTVPAVAGTVRCPGPLPATVGAAITCTATENGQPVNLRATVSSVQGRDVKFDITRA